MKIRVILAASVMALAAIGVAGASAASAAPAAAPSNVCSGQGRATLSAGLWAVGLGPAKTVSFNITVTCQAGTQPSVTATGTLTGNCGRSTGSGTINGKPFTLETAGSALVLTGPDVAGTGNAVSDPREPNNSCTNGTATIFIVTGAVAY